MEPRPASLIDEALSLHAVLGSKQHFAGFVINRRGWPGLLRLHQSSARRDREGGVGGTDALVTGFVNASARALEAYKHGLCAGTGVHANVKPWAS